MKNTKIVKKIAILGQNIDYSLSPTLFNEQIVQSRFPNEFKIINLMDTISWTDFWNSKSYLDYDYLCVTTPWKSDTTKLNLNTEPTYEVLNSQVANWIIVSNNKLKLLNTDSCAFEYWWNDLPKVPEKIYYLSTGASLLSFLSMLKTKFKLNDLKNKIKIIIVSRDKEKFKYNNIYEQFTINVQNYNELYKNKFNHNDLVINGSYYGQKLEIPVELIKVFEQTMLWDLNYAKEKSYYTFYEKNGLDFLVLQAISFFIKLKIISPTEFNNFYQTLYNSIQLTNKNIQK